MNRIEEKQNRIIKYRLEYSQFIRFLNELSNQLNTGESKFKTSQNYKV